MRDAEQQRTDRIRTERPRRSRRRRVRDAQRENGGEQSERQVDEEHRAPRQVLGEIRAEHRARGAREREYRCEITRVAPALARRDVLADEGLRERHEPPASQALQRAEGDEPPEARRERARKRREREHGQRAKQRATPSVTIADIAV